MSTCTLHVHFDQKFHTLNDRYAYFITAFAKIVTAQTRFGSFTQKMNIQPVSDEINSALDCGQNTAIFLLCLWAGVTVW